MINLYKILTIWHKHHKRELPWRNAKDPYLIWISEIILQQTRIAQGHDYYLRFVDLFPTVRNLANASDEQVLKVWQGLGYYSRARNLHKTAKIITELYGERFPKTYHELLRLPGIGSYTAAAIASIAFNEPHAVIDGNVYRVLSRIFGINTPIDSSAGKKIFEELANKLIDQEHPGDYNEAIMDFGAIQCIPRKPDCSACPVSSECVALKHDLISSLPVKSKKMALRNRYLNYLIIRHHSYYYIEKRIANDIWRNLYQFPLVESSIDLPLETVLTLPTFQNLISGASVHLGRYTAPTRHLLSHQRLWIRFIHITISEPLPENQYAKVNLEELHKLPVPKPIGEHILRYLSDFD